MKVMALDIGHKRIGIATGDTSLGIACPRTVIPTHEVLAPSSSWQELLEEVRPEILISGLPYSLDGTEQKQAQRVRMTAKDIAKQAGLPLEFIDERASSIQAKRIMHELGLTEREMRGRLDMLAASLFLQTWFDRREANSKYEHSKRRVHDG